MASTDVSSIPGLGIGGRKYPMCAFRGGGGGNQSKPAALRVSNHIPSLVSAYPMFIYFSDPTRAGKCNMATGIDYVEF